ncbi:MAG: T9SS type A sorting domain-containing protein, partial [Saprospiraceae bacterium]|nr:T9SS type A sorting domain-containing protein [Saprospiraceae bacterium]
IQVLSAGEYEVSFNTKTLEYNFEKIIHYRGISILFTTASGDSTTTTAMTRDPDDASIWRLRIDLSDGFLIFNADTTLIFFWGGVGFPSGIATHELDLISVPAGRYNITFNSTKAEYNFDLLKSFATLGIIGTATSIGTWDEDVKMTRDSLDNDFWYINSIQLADGEVKFRADDNWSNYWGGVNFPAGIGTQDGRSVPIVAGTYRVSINTATGEYNFMSTTRSVYLLKPAAVRIFPNPALDEINILLRGEDLGGDIQIILFNQLGVQVQRFKLNVGTTIRIDVSDLPAGNYLVHISNANFAIGKKVIILK